MQLCAIPIATDDPAELKHRLWDDYQIEVPIITWQDYTFVRVSLQAYNSVEDGERLVEALKALL